MTGNTTPSPHSFSDSRKLDTKTLTSWQTLREFSSEPGHTSALCRRSHRTAVRASAVRRRRGVSSVQLWADGAAAQRYWWLVCETLYPSRPSRSCYHYIYIPCCFIGPPCLTSTFTLGLLLLTLTYLTPRCMPVNVLSYFRETWELRERKWSV